MGRDKTLGLFIWDIEKEQKNKEKHKIGFVSARRAFFDKQRIIIIDEKHSKVEKRYFCIGKIGQRVVTVRFTFRDKFIRIIGAGYWRKGRSLYEEKNR